MGGVALRTLGRQYPGEDRLRWSLGLYAWRDGSSPWVGPPDPVLIDETVAPVDLGVFQATLAARFADTGARIRAFTGTDGSRRGSIWSSSAARIGFGFRWSNCWTSPID